MDGFLLWVNCEHIKLHKCYGKVPIWLGLLPIHQACCDSAPCVSTHSSTEKGLVVHVPAFDCVNSCMLPAFLLAYRGATTAHHWTQEAHQVHQVRMPSGQTTHSSTLNIINFVSVQHTFCSILPHEHLWDGLLPTRRTW